MEISLEALVRIIVSEVLAELARRGVVPGIPGAAGNAPPGPAGPETMAIDMSGYRTPVLTEQRVRSLGPRVREVTVPAGTICTIGAREVLSQRRMKLTFTGTTH